MDEDEQKALREWQLETSKELRQYYNGQAEGECLNPICSPNEYSDSEIYREKMYSKHIVLEKGECPNLAEYTKEGITIKTDYDALMVAAAIHNQFENNDNYSHEEIIKCARLIFCELGFDGLADKLRLVDAVLAVIKTDKVTQQIKGKRQEAGLTKFQEEYIASYKAQKEHSPSLSHSALVKATNEHLNVKHQAKTVNSWLIKSNK
ncbi:hypothetical protein FAP94_16925 [Morganella morganii]|nr:hypothetical protein [Morganella morganii]